MKRSSVITTLILAAIVAAVVAKISVPSSSGGTAVSSSENQTMKRILASNTLRCGYALWPSYLDKDPNTGEFSGIFYDYMNKVAQSTGLKIEWTMEVGYGDFIEALKSNKIDAMCSGIWMNTIRTKSVYMIQPLFYQPLLAYVKSDNTQFDGALEKINNPAVKIAVIDGEGSELTARQMFPKAEFVQLPQLTEGSQLLINVATGKADLTLTDSVTAGRYQQNNPGVLEAVKLDYPVSIYGVTIAIDQDEPQLKFWLDTITRQMIGSGDIEGFLQKHEPFPNAYYRARPDFIDPATK